MGNHHSSETTVHVHQPESGDQRPGAIEINTGKDNYKYYALSGSEIPYSIELVNDTTENYHFAVYQEFPLSAGLKSVAWQVRRVPKRRSSPTTNKVSWQLKYGIATTNWDANDHGFSGDQVQDAVIGNTYEVISDGEFPVINSNPTGKTKEGQIVFTNKTSSPNAQDLDMGFTIDDKIVASQIGVHPNEGVLFDIHPKYYIACYRNIKLGQLVDTGVVLGPIDLEFRDGATKMTVKAYMDGGEFKLKKY